MQHAAFGIYLVQFHAAGLGHAQAMPEHQEQQATVAHLVPAVLSRFHQPFNLARGEMLPVADLCQPPASVPRRSLPPCRTSRFSAFLACLSFCREFTLSDAPETRMNRGGDFSTMNKRDHFVESGSFCLGNGHNIPLSTERLVKFKDFDRN